MHITVFINSVCNNIFFFFHFFSFCFSAIEPNDDLKSNHLIYFCKFKKRFLQGNLHSDPKSVYHYLSSYVCTQDMKITI